jgi:hypothetical protein
MRSMMSMISAPHCFRKPDSEGLDEHQSSVARDATVYAPLFFRADNLVDCMFVHALAKQLSDEEDIWN